jgi:hypothetical protein
MRKQMHKLHLLHRKSGYISNIDYQQIIDTEGQLDWEMLYTPGPKARAEYKAFVSRRLPAPSPQSPGSEPEPASDVTPEPDADPALLAEMTRRGISEKKALVLLRNLNPGQDVLDQLEYIDSLVAHAPRGKFHNPPGLYITAIQENSPVPDGFITSRKQRLREEARESQNGERGQQARLEIEYDEYEAAEIQRYIGEVIPREEYQRMFAKLRQDNSRIFKQFSAAQLDELTARSVADELKQSGCVPLLSFKEFCLQQRNNHSASSLRSAEV